MCLEIISIPTQYVINAKRRWVLKGLQGRREKSVLVPGRIMIIMRAANWN